jgi:hypothetical protein
VSFREGKGRKGRRRRRRRRRTAAPELVWKEKREGLDILHGRKEE